MAKFSEYDEVMSPEDTDYLLIDRAPYTGDAVKKIQKSNLVTGGRVRDSSTLLSITTVDTTGYTLYNAPDHVVVYTSAASTASDYVNTSTGEYLTPV